MTTMQLLGFLAVVQIGHWAGDFLAQTHWQASNKPWRWDALLLHAFSYTCVLLVTVAVATALFVRPTPLLLVGLSLFVIGNGVLHFVTDAGTSHMSAGLFSRWMTDVRRMHYLRAFFVVLDVDQMIHQLTFLATLAAILRHA